MPSASKLDQEVAKARIPVKEARFYNGKLLREISASIEKGDLPEVLIVKSWNEKRSLWEVQIIAIAPKHRFEPSYPTKDPAICRRTGQIILTPEAATRMGRELIRVASATRSTITPLSRFTEFQPEGAESSRTLKEKSEASESGPHK